MTYALILATHGSTDRPSANDSMFEIAERIKSRCSFSTVTPAFMQGEPNIRTVLGQIQEEKILVVRWMTGHGYYSDVVFPRYLNSTESTKQIDILSIVGSDARVAGSVSTRISSLVDEYDLDELETSVIVVGHGTRKNKKSCRSTIALVKKLRCMQPNLKFEFAFLQQRPGLSLVAKRVALRNKIVIPFLMGQGPHATVDIPTEFGLPTNENATNSIAMENEGWTICDRPLGNYPELIQIALDIQQRHLAKTPAGDSNANIPTRPQKAFRNRMAR